MSPLVRLLATTLLATTITYTAQGQLVGVGLKLGPQASHTPSELLETRWLPGAVAGLYVPWGVAPKLELQPEVLVQAIGSGYVSPTGERTSMRSLYVQVPLSFKLYLSNTVNLHAGVFAMRVLAARNVVANEGTDFADRLNRMDYGLHGGMGLDLASGLDLTLRYTGGMTPILANDQSFFPHNRMASFTVGYRMAQLKVGKITRRRR